MMNFWFLLAALGVSYLVQVALGVLQMRDFAANYGALRRRGKVAIGKRTNALSAGSIAMFLVDDDGIVREARAMSGLTIVARFKPLKGFEGLDVARLDERALARLPRGLRLAAANARDNWLVVQRGETPEDPPGPLTRTIAWIRSRRLTASPKNRVRDAVRTERVPS